MQQTLNIPSRSKSKTCRMCTCVGWDTSREASWLVQNETRSNMIGKHVEADHLISVSETGPAWVSTSGSMKQFSAQCKLKNHKLPGASSSFEKAWEGRTMRVFFQVYSPQWQTLILEATRPFSANFCLSYAQISHGGVWAANELSSKQHVTGSTLGHWEKNKLMCKTNCLKCHGQRSNFGQSVTRRFPHDFWSKYDQNMIWTHVRCGQNCLFGENAITKLWGSP